MEEARAITAQNFVSVLLVADDDRQDFRAGYLKSFAQSFELEFDLEPVFCQA